MDTTLRRTRLYDEHLALKGRMVPFAGWELPLHYATSPSEEHTAVRTAAGLFDIDHMGQFRCTGPDALRFLQAFQTADLCRVATWGAHYSLLPYADGGLVDDLFIYHLDDAWWIVVNAANRDKDLRWLTAHAQGYDLRLDDISEETYMLALQGPRAQVILQRVTDIDLAVVPFHTCAWGTVAGVRTLIGATGYTGEYGYELFFPADAAVAVWRALLAAGAGDGLLPCGLAARDSLRLDACLPLYGHELTAATDPYAAGLGVFVHLDKGDFLGRDALLKVKLEGPARRLVAFVMQEPAVPRDGYPVQADGRDIGRVTSGMKSSTTGQFVGLAYVQAEFATPGTPLSIIVRDKPKRAEVVRKPFYIPAYRR